LLGERWWKIEQPAKFVDIANGSLHLLLPGGDRSERQAANSKRWNGHFVGDNH
jgi:hypothetical protein